MAQLAQVTKFMELIAEQNRLRILCLLRRGERCVCEIWRYLNLSQTLASHHLKIMKDFGLILSRREGSKIYYYLNQTFINKYFGYLRKFIDFD